MKVSTKSLSWRLITHYTNPSQRTIETMNSCQYVTRVIRGILSAIVLSWAIAVILLCVMDFMFWVGFSVYGKTVLEPSTAAVLVMVVIVGCVIVGSYNLCVLGLRKMLNFYHSNPRTESTDDEPPTPSFIGQVIRNWHDKICTKIEIVE